ncbi:ABC transporter ATP-binding protein [Effusibacillus pohliae]|uniref:ABC transporter ATP-binding protein n=1 Tax=Effusibacillus pohliae TaxID=232270 RepID=UPI000380980A|nr:ABC transporter ATP-binding protein [Effusibacillus pohliae]
MNLAIRMRNVVKTYDSKRVLDGLDADFPAGGVIGLLGQNGAGKSTLFKMIVGLVRPDAGEIQVFGQKPDWRLNADIAYLPDRGRWYPHHSLAQAFEYAEAVFPRFDRNKALVMAEEMGLDLEQKVASLSKGQEARLLLTLCLAREARLVLLDEPFSGIDLVSRERIIQGIIDSMMERPRTIVISTHEIHEAESLFDHVVIIDQGRVVLADEAEKLRSQQASIESIYRRLFR